MYYLKFLKWVWTSRLKDTEDKCLFGLAVWMGIFILSFLVSMITHNGSYMAIYLIASGSIGGTVAVLFGLYFLVKLIKRLFNEWESQVFDKLRGGPDAER